MSDNIQSIKAQITTALKSGDKDRVTVLRMLLNRATLSAKSDGNRLPTDADLLQAAVKTVKELNDTRDIYLGRGTPTQREDAEIKIVSEFLPPQMSTDDLRALINGLAQHAQGKGLRGQVMKVLNTEHKGAYDPQAANAILEEIVGATA